MMGNESKSARSCVVEEFARLTQERDEALATIETLRRRVAELEGDKATPRQFFSYDPDDGFEEFDTAEEAKARAETSLDLWRDSAGDGWSDESMRVCWGIICQSIRIVDQQEYDPEKHVFVSPDCAWVEERILCSDDASKEISRLEAENADLKRRVEALREDAEVGLFEAQSGVPALRVGKGVEIRKCVSFVAGKADWWYIVKNIHTPDQSYWTNDGWSSISPNQYPSMEWAAEAALEALREAAKGEVE